MVYSVPNFLIKKVIKSYQKKAEWKNIPLVRRGFERLTARWRKEEPLVEWEPMQIGNIHGAWLKPRAAFHSKKVWLYLHGGGYAAGSPNTHRNIVTPIVLNTDIKVLLIDYRLAPENPYPAALEDAVFAYKWLLENGHSPSNISIGGDSAGGGLTLATLLFLKENQLPMPASAVCISPWTDLSCSFATHRTNAEKETMLIPEALPYWAKNYYADTDPTDKFVSPAFGDFTGFPPLLIHVGDEEILLDDSLAVIEKAKAQGVAVEATVFKGYFHVFHGFWGFLSKARKANNEIKAFLLKTIAE